MHNCRKGETALFLNDLKFESNKPITKYLIFNQYVKARALGKFIYALVILVLLSSFAFTCFCLNP